MIHIHESFSSDYYQGWKFEPGWTFTTLAEEKQFLAVSPSTSLTKYQLRLKEKLWLKVYHGMAVIIFLRHLIKNIFTPKAVSNLK